MKFEWKRLLPKYWYQSSPTDWEWDAVLNDILDNANQVEISNYVVKIDNVCIWAANWPYAYGNLYHHGTKSGVPSIKTRNRLKNVVEVASKKQFRENIEKIRKS